MSMSTVESATETRTASRVSSSLQVPADRRVDHVLRGGQGQRVRPVEHQPLDPAAEVRAG